MSELTEIIKAELDSGGPMPFARFMELALYCPDYGYYERENDTIGRRGDFYTNVSVGPLFGQLLAFQFAEWLEPEAGGLVCLVEAGAHDGRLAADILTWLEQHRPALFARLEYYLVEPSARRKRKQQEQLGRFGGKVGWYDSLQTLPRLPGGVVFSNELLDAMPVERYGWDAGAKAWFEWGVHFVAGQFQWVKLPRRPALVAPWLPAELLSVLPDGFTIDQSLAAERWWANAAKVVQRGWLMACDYGLEELEFFSPHRADGTLRAYSGHRVGAAVLASPGGQDLTANVNFTRIRRAGEAAGLRTTVFATQAEFLGKLVSRFWEESVKEGPLATPQTRQLQTLMHPEHLGRAFRVLVQRGVGEAALTDNPVGHNA
jgi:SAM-dependent MidA family methyltransferase